MKRQSQSGSATSSPQKASLDSLAIPSLTLSRRSSKRSVRSNAISSAAASSSSSSSRDLPESVNQLAKSLFGRRQKPKREHPFFPANSSFFITEDRIDAPLPPLPTQKESFSMPSIFTRRKAPKKPESSSEGTPKKIHISGPYAFQHVAHTCRDELPSLQRGTRLELAHDFSANRALQRPSNGSLKGIQADSLYCSNEPAGDEAPGVIDNTPLVGLPYLVVPDQDASRAGSLHSLAHSKSSDHLRPRPTRPPAPLRPHLGLPSSPVPPPRSSSRQSNRGDGVDSVMLLSVPAAIVDRPRTSSGLSDPHHFTLDPERLIPIRAKCQPESNLAKTLEASDAPIQWPLTTADAGASLDKALPDLPEEDENRPLNTKPSHASLASIAPSLRACQSVPLLRKLAQLQQESRQRPPSGVSDTLGFPDTTITPHSIKVTLEGEGGEGSEDLLDADNWEDDIDYCYEHDANADFDYEWSRASIDLSRSLESRTPVHELDRTVVYLDTPKASTELPALSPSSQVSYEAHSEVGTPTALSAANLLLPRPDLVPGEPASCRSSLFILGDDNQYGSQYGNQYFSAEPFEYPYIGDWDDNLTMRRPASFKTRSRSSTTTTAMTDFDSRSNFSYVERHSVSSNQTALTRFTASSGSLSVMGGWKQFADKPSPLPLSTNGQDMIPPPPTPTSPASSKFLMAPVPERKSSVHRTQGHVSRASDSTPVIMARAKSREQQAKERRPRATTTGAGSHPPPPQQFSLFPRATYNNRI